MISWTCRCSRGSRINGLTGQVVSQGSAAASRRTRRPGDQACHDPKFWSVKDDLHRDGQITATHDMQQLPSLRLLRRKPRIRRRRSHLLHALLHSFPRSTPRPSSLVFSAPPALSLWPILPPAALPRPSRSRPVGWCGRLSHQRPSLSSSSRRGLASSYQSHPIDDASPVRLLAPRRCSGAYPCSRISGLRLKCRPRGRRCAQLSIDGYTFPFC